MFSIIAKNKKILNEATEDWIKVECCWSLLANKAEFFFFSREAKVTFVRPTVAVNVLLSSSCSRSSCSQIIYGGKSGFLSEGSRGHPPCVHQYNLSTWPQHLSTHKSAGSPWHSCFFVIFFPSTCLHLQVTCCNHRSLFFLFCYFFLLLVWPDPTCPFGNISNWMLPYPGRATHIHHGCCRPDSWWFRTLGVLAARQRCQLLHSLTTAAASHGCFPAVTPASRQEEALSLSLALSPSTKVKNSRVDQC